MGLGIEVLIVDWPRAEAAPGDRETLLTDAASGEAYSDDLLIAGWWQRAAPHLESLRMPFTRHAADSSGWITTFESFAYLLTDWGEVVTEAERRGWGIVGLRC
ncbi:hypothetical protein [Streptomyces sp. NPDC001388]|uniref:hypothetical protein n=1 Tax=unclassified Streptomyces TaxID=2593676 RepID=UPI00367CE1AA